MGATTPGVMSTNQIVQTVGSIASTSTVAILGATSAASIAAGGSGLILGMTPSLAMPIIGAAIMAATLGIELILNSGCGQTCIISSNWANNAETLLTQNIAAYFALPAPRSAEAKAQALANFDNVWNYLSQECSNPSLGNAGVRCIQDRMAGACTWKQTHAPDYPGQPDIGACWNWFNGYRDPIENDPAVVTDTTVTGNLNGIAPSSGSSSFAGLDTGTLALIGAGGLMLFALMGSN